MKRLNVVILMNDNERIEHEKVKISQTYSDTRFLGVEMVDGDKHYYNLDLVKKFSHFKWEDEEKEEGEQK